MAAKGTLYTLAGYTRQKPVFRLSEKVSLEIDLWSPRTDIKEVKKLV